MPTGIGKALPVTDEILRHLKWMMEKDNLGQDMFLIGFLLASSLRALSDQASGSRAEMARVPVLRSHATRG